MSISVFPFFFFSILLPHDRFALFSFFEPVSGSRCKAQSKQKQADDVAESAFLHFDPIFGEVEACGSVTRERERERERSGKVMQNPSSSSF